MCTTNYAPPNYIPSKYENTRNAFPYYITISSTIKCSCPSAETNCVYFEEEFSVSSIYNLCGGGRGSYRSFADPCLFSTGDRSLDKLSLRELSCILMLVENFHSSSSLVIGLLVIMSEIRTFSCMCL